MAEEKSPFKVAPAAAAAINPALISTAISAGASLLGGIFGARSANRASRRAERKERLARMEMDRMKQIYSNLDTSNPYLNMENTMEDLTINQKQAQFESQQFQQSQANILSGLRGAAGGSGVAAVAQALAQQGQLQAQRSAASIGAQESRNQILRQREASRLQSLERQGELTSRVLERQKVTGLLSMAQAETAAYGQQAAAAQRARSQAIGGAFSGIAQAGIAGLQAGAFDNIGGTDRKGTVDIDFDEMNRLSNVDSQGNSLVGIQTPQVGSYVSQNLGTRETTPTSFVPFGEAFNKAFRDGDSNFMWNGNLYTTDLAGENQPIQNPPIVNGVSIYPANSPGFGNQNNYLNTYRTQPYSGPRYRY